MGTSPSDPKGDLKLNGTSNGGNSSDDDDEVVIGEADELAATNTSTNNSSTSETNPFNAFNSTNGVGLIPPNEMTGASNDLGFFHYEAAENDDPFGDRPIPEWVAWGSVSDFQASGSSLNPFEDNHVNSTGAHDASISTTSGDETVPNGVSSSSESSDPGQRNVVVPSLFEEDVEFVGAELEGSEKAMDKALKEGIVGEAGALKRNMVPQKPEKEDSDDGVKEFNDANYWRVDQEVAVLE